VARTSRPRYDALDGLRAIAAVSIVLLHTWMYTDANWPRPGRTDLLDRVMGELRVGMVLFFVLTGFLLALPYARGRAPDLGRYALRRLARVGPAYWLAILGSLYVLHDTGHPRDIALHDVPKFGFFLANLFPETRNKLDPPMWSMHVEVSFYVVLPLIGLALLRAKRPQLVCLSLVAASLVFTTLGAIEAWPPETTWTLPTYLGAFACGIAAAFTAPKEGLSLFILAAGAAAVFLNSVWHSAPDGTGTFGHAVGDLPAAAGFAAIAWAVAARPPRLLTLAPVRYVGTVSFGLYLWHMPVLYSLQIDDKLPERFWPAIQHILPVTFLLAVASWHLVEKPALKLTDRFLASRRAATAAEPPLAAGG
jgi:peptidoglycan/LPS O-acetylase OafA/YrhL